MTAPAVTAGLDQHPTSHPKLLAWVRSADGFQRQPFVPAEEQVLEHFLALRWLGEMHAMTHQLPEVRR